MKITEEKPEKDLYLPDFRKAQYAALRNPYVRTSEEFRLYTKAIYNALQWGRKS